MASISSRSHRRTSVATWSLRERPVCSRLPASPASAIRAGLDVEVHVFELELPFERAGLDLVAHTSAGRAGSRPDRRCRSRPDRPAWRHGRGCRRCRRATGAGRRRRSRCVALHELAHSAPRTGPTRLRSSCRTGSATWAGRDEGSAGCRVRTERAHCTRPAIANRVKAPPRPGPGWGQCPPCARPRPSRFYRRPRVARDGGAVECAGRRARFGALDRLRRDGVRRRRRDAVASRPRARVGVRRVPCRRRAALARVRARRDGDRHGLRRHHLPTVARPHGRRLERGAGPACSPWAAAGVRPEALARRGAAHGAVGDGDRARRDRRPSSPPSSSPSSFPIRSRPASLPSPARARPAPAQRWPRPSSCGCGCVRRRRCRPRPRPGWPSCSRAFRPHFLFKQRSTPR